MTAIILISVFIFLVGMLNVSISGVFGGYYCSAAAIIVVLATIYAYELFDKKFIEPLDWYDNNGSSNQLAAVIYSFNKPWDDNTPGTDFRFFSAVKLAMTILEQYISSIRALARAKSLALSSKVDGETIYLDRYAPVSEFVSGNPDINFIKYMTCKYFLFFFMIHCVLLSFSINNRHLL